MWRLTSRMIFIRNTPADRIIFIRNSSRVQGFPGLAVRPEHWSDGAGSLAVVLDRDQVQPVKFLYCFLDRPVTAVGAFADSVVRCSATVLLAPVDKVQDI